MYLYPLHSFSAFSLGIMVHWDLTHLGRLWRVPSLALLTRRQEASFFGVGLQLTQMTKFFPLAKSSLQEFPSWFKELRAQHCEDVVLIPGLAQLSSQMHSF